MSQFIPLARALSLAACSGLLAFAAAAQDTELLDVVFPRTSPNPSSRPTGFYEVGGKVFVATGVGLFRCDANGRVDGLATTTIPAEVAVVGNELLFTDGLRQLHRIGPSGPAEILSPRNVQSLSVRGSDLFFAATDLAGAEPWIYSATSGPRRIEDVNPGAASSDPREFTALGTQVYFVATDAVAGEELWRTDGTASGTVRVIDLAPGPAGSRIAHLTASASRMWFFYARWPNLPQLASTDGTAAGTAALMVAEPDASLVRFGTGVAYLQFGSNSGLYLATDQGQLSGKVPLPLMASVARTTIRPLVVGNLLYFGVPTPVGNTLWRSDGTAAGTAQLSPYADHLEPGGSLAPLGSQVLFSAGAGSAQGCELWGTDGTARGTRELIDLHPRGSARPSALTAIQGHVWFAAADGVHGVEPWRTDGTVLGTRLVGNLRNFAVSSDPQREPQIVEAEGAGWFIDESPTHGTLWRTTGEAGATSVQVPVLTTGFRFLRPALGKVFFLVDNAANPLLKDLVVSDGTASGTRRISSGIGYSVMEWVDLGGVALFNGGANGLELWRTDGTPSGTRRVGTQQISAARMTRRFTPQGTRAYFPGPNQELMVSDGTVAGTRVVAAVASVPMANGAVVDGARIAFVSRSGALWITDGTTAGTISTPLANVSLSLVFLAANSQGFFVGLLDFRYQGRLYFVDRAGSAVALGSGLPPINGFQILNDRLFFTGTTSATGAEPWVSDGTVAGTQLLRDVEPGPGSSVPERLRVGSRFVYFVATVNLRQEIWRTDGTPAGTVAIGSEPVATRRLAQVNNKLLFFGEDVVLGPQLYAVNLWANTQEIGGACAAGLRIPTLRVSDPVLGQPMRFDLDSPHGLAPAVAVLGAPWTRGVVLSLPGGCRLAFDPQGPTRLLSMRTDPRGRASVSVSVPANPALSGLQLAAQAAVGATSQGPFGTDLTAGALLKVER